MSGKNKKLSKKCSNLLILRDSYLTSGECSNDQKLFWKTLECNWSIFKVSSIFFFKVEKMYICVHFACTHVILFKFNQNANMHLYAHLYHTFRWTLSKITCVQTKCTFFQLLNKNFDETLKIDQVHSKVFQKQFWSLLHSPLIRYGSLKFSKFEHFLDNFLFLPDIAYFYFAL